MGREERIKSTDTTSTLPASPSGSGDRPTCFSTRDGRRGRGLDNGAFPVPLDQGQPEETECLFLLEEVVISTDSTPPPRRP
ncbi:hypothetical protein MRX96_039061 [Rhipicephalus microplus]